MVADVLRSFAEVVGRQMGVTQRRLCLRVAEQCADHRQGVAECVRHAGMTMPEIVQMQFGGDASGALDSIPRFFYVGNRPAIVAFADHHIRISLHALEAVQHVIKIRGDK